MKQKLDEYRLQALGQLEHEQSNRPSRASALHAEGSKLEAENEVALPRILRAQEPLPGPACPRCWIWDGHTNALGARRDADGVDFFQCVQCGHTVEAPIEIGR
jgi:hypothetical protein